MDRFVLVVCEIRRFSFLFPKFKGVKRKRGLSVLFFIFSVFVSLVSNKISLGGFTKSIKNSGEVAKKKT